MNCDVHSSLEASRPWTKETTHAETFEFLLFTRYHEGDEIEEVVLGERNNRYGESEREMHTHPKGKDNLKDIIVNVTIT
jgi:hypothetical protein